MKKCLSIELVLLILPKYYIYFHHALKVELKIFFFHHCDFEQNIFFTKLISYILYCLSVCLAKLSYTILGLS